MYKQDGHFTSHTDTEKEPGMFGTLVISLPCQHTGGSLVVTHKEQKMEFDSASDWTTCHYSAFFADCTHELKTVFSGYRIALTYNLVLVQPIEVDVFPSAELHGTLGQRPEGLVTYGHSETKHKPLVYILDHSYTQGGLTFYGLKGKDRISANALLAHSKEAGVEVMLASVQMDFFGDDRYHEYSSVNLPTLGPLICSSGMRLKGSTTDLMNVQFVNSDGPRLPEYFQGQEKLAWGGDEGEELERRNFTGYRNDRFWTDEGSYHKGDTGNEGSPFEIWYRAAALVIVQRTEAVKLIKQHDEPILHEYFHDRLSRYSDTSENYSKDTEGNVGDVDDY